MSTGPLATWGDSIMSFVLLLLVIFAWNHLSSILFFVAVYYNLAVASDHMRQVSSPPALFCPMPLSLAGLHHPPRLCLLHARSRIRGGSL